MFYIISVQLLDFLYFYCTFALLLGNWQILYSNENLAKKHRS
jgi:hypothetical protein